MLRIAGPLLGFVLALAITPANAQAGATPATPHPFTASELHEPPAQSPTVDDFCHALEQGAAENALPVEFFARVIWQESRLARKTFLVFAGPFHISAIANQSQQHEHKRSG
jgi:hypothetical protein